MADKPEKEEKEEKEEKKKVKVVKFHCNHCGQDVDAGADAKDIKCPHCGITGYVSTKENAAIMKKGRRTAKKLAEIRKIALNPEKAEEQINALDDLSDSEE